MHVHSKSLAVITLLAGTLLVASQWRTADGEEKQAGMKMLRHVVLFKFKESAKPEELREIEAAFRALPSKIDSVVDFEWGTNNSPEGLNKGYTHCFFVTFQDEAGREKYLPHPAHQQFVAVLRPALDDVLVIDYWTQD